MMFTPTTQDKRYKYKAFLSYNHADAHITKWLHRKLEAYRVPKYLIGTQTGNGVAPKTLFPIFRDREDLAASTHMTDAILDALANSEFLIVVCTPNAARSTLVNREIEEFKRVHGNKNILCLIADGTPFSNDPDTECFPLALQQHINPDGSTAGWAPEGLAADMRPGSDGKKAAISKIVAGMLGVDLNDLRRRELQRSRNRLLIALTASISAFAMISVLLATTYNSRQLAKERTDALLDLLLKSHTEIFQAFDADGNTRAQEALIRATLRQFETFDLEYADVDTLGFWSGTALRLAQNIERQGKNAEAAELFLKIRNFSRRFASSHPKSHFARFRHQNAEFFYGYLQQRLGHYNKAEDVFRNRLRINEDAVNDPTLTIYSPNLVIDWSTRLADSQKMLGALLAGPQDKTDEAEQLLTATIKSLLTSIETFTPNASDPDDSYYQDSLSSTYAYRGDLMLRLGKLKTAKSYFQNSIDTRKFLLTRSPEHRGQLRRLSNYNISMAQTLLDMGDMQGALALAKNATTTLKNLSTENAASVLWLSNWVDAQNFLMHAAFVSGDLPLAQQMLAESNETSRLLAERDGMRPHYRLARYRNQLLQIELAYSANKTEEAFAQLEALISNIENENDSFRFTNGAMEFLTRTYLLLAVKTSDAHSAKALETVARIAAERPDPWPEAQAYHAAALKKLNRENEAETILAHLDTLGFDYQTLLKSLPL